MSAVLRARILGCGSSGGVPRVDGDWGACDPEEPKNRRLRCSLLLEAADSMSDLVSGKVTRALIDTAPDLRAQLLAAHVTTLDAVVYTHAHADQAHGIDDVRAIVYRRGERLAAHMSPETAREITHRFDYIFQTPAGSSYPPLMTAHAHRPGEAFEVTGPGGAMALSLFDVEHGGAACSGVRAGPLAYTPDVSGLDDRAFQALEGAQAWIVDALRDKPHPSHAHLARTLDWLEQVKPQLGVLTNLHIDLDYAALLARLPDGVRPAYDGLEIVIEDGKLRQVSAV
ncbi:MBL fold metallo-hydrolase [Alkalicaulis satelles]|uniref:MBL fold metallo-hydrolase n=1 Tax=Alkalicaulis satelles TaxID=2609175 RepID=A0A5M6ZLE9_9PROT|nr:MBL fold metallo-hydrolase [Alkalicaulis satelles]KAA5804775.1 MBL fold metallo-hydrolase [Alkalicaulis satelles]